ncbi:uncharacterized protein B0H18DRAFT_1175151 [Fomitopsis serialis]|uniref:uncharacterized protein n=1 Tax=Fomitopsis serialis TaxID=139415 RepID=UPI0020078627|nr:uncharacterized protein B0H18DRAFT_1175151 [Neoantrodia serialis]KAH9924493.1 hypothetical protein B0H18DRAFT_1175151 [Neoantrodia serialis]
MDTAVRRAGDCESRSRRTVRMGKDASRRAGALEKGAHLSSAENYSQQPRLSAQTYGSTRRPPSVERCLPPRTPSSPACARFCAAGKRTIAARKPREEEAFPIAKLNFMHLEHTLNLFNARRTAGTCRLHAGIRPPKTALHNRRRKRTVRFFLRCAEQVALDALRPSNTPVFYRNSNASDGALAGSVVLNNVVRWNNVPTAVTVLNGAEVLAGGTMTIDSSGASLRAACSAPATGGSAKFMSGNIAAHTKASGLLSNSRIFGRTIPQYEDYAVNQFYSGCSIIYFNTGTYIVSSTPQIGSKSWSMGISVTVL